MKAIVFFEAKEVCRVEFDRHERLDNEFNFYLNDVIVGSFCYGYCFVVDENKNEIKVEIDHTLFQSIIGDGMSTSPYIGGASTIGAPFHSLKTFK